jgi:hypothetical protein
VVAPGTLSGFWVPRDGTLTGSGRPSSRTSNRAESRGVALVTTTSHPAPTSSASAIRAADSEHPASCAIVSTFGHEAPRSAFQWSATT